MLTETDLLRLRSRNGASSVRPGLTGLAQVSGRDCVTVPEKARLAVQLRRFENMPYEEIARALDMTVPATKSLLFRARNMLKESLASFLS